MVHLSRIIDCPWGHRIESYFRDTEISVWDKGRRVTNLAPDILNFSVSLMKHMNELWLIEFGQIRFFWHYLLTRPCITEASHSFISVWSLMICPLLVPYDNFLRFQFLRGWLSSWNLILLCHFAHIDFLNETRCDVIWILSLNILTLVNESNFQLKLFSLSLQFFYLFVLLFGISFKLQVFRFQFRIILHHLFGFWIW